MATFLSRIRPDVAPIRHSRQFRLLYFELAGAAALAGRVGRVRPSAGALLAGGVLTGGLPLAYAVGGAAGAGAAGPFAGRRGAPPAPDAGRPSLGGLAEGLRYAKSRPDL